MKSLMLVAFASIMLLSCREKDFYNTFSSNESDFVIYKQGQTIKFIDTNLISRTLIQTAYKREFVQQIGMFTVGRKFSETYQSSYLTQTGAPVIGLSVSVAHTNNMMDIEFLGYRSYSAPDLLSSFKSPVLINGVSYNDVYILKMFNTKAPGASASVYGNQVNINGQTFPNNDTATLYHNKQYGVIQLLFPTGKRIFRTE